MPTPQPIFSRNFPPPGQNIFATWNCPLGRLDDQNIDFQESNNITDKRKIQKKHVNTVFQICIRLYEYVSIESHLEPRQSNSQMAWTCSISGSIVWSLLTFWNVCSGCIRWRANEILEKWEFHCSGHCESNIWGGVISRNPLPIWVQKTLALN